jgi:xylulokinase
MENYVITYDVGTTGIKSCLYQIDDSIKLVQSAMQGYKLYVLENGGAEQDPAEWWDAMCNTTKRIFEHTKIKKEQIAGISFCSQMQGLVLVDKNGNPLRRAMSYMDQRSTKEIKEGMAYGLQIAGANIGRLLKSLYYTGAVAASVKDPVWKYKWVENNEPEVFAKIYKWLDVKEFLIGKCTDRYIMTADSAFGTMLYDVRPGKNDWAWPIVKMLGVKPEHLPEIVQTTDCVGGLTKKAAEELGLLEGVKVFGGGGDCTLIGIGAGCTEVGDTHIYSGTSGWVSTVVDKSMVDTTAMIASVVGAEKGKFNYFAEMETSGKSLEWVKDHLCLDEIDIYLDKKHVAEDVESKYVSLYDYMTDSIADVPAGCNGVIFAPWLHGNRCPFEDPNSRGMFFNISLETGKRELIRAVVEGVCYHDRWMLEASSRKVKPSEVIRFVGGGALSDFTSQVLADITGHKIEVVENPQNIGAVGAAAVVGVGMGIIPSFSAVKKFIPAKKCFKPGDKNKAAYDRNFEVFKNLYYANAKNFAALNKR